MEDSGPGPARWIVVAPDDSVSRRLLERLGERARFISCDAGLVKIDAANPPEAVVYRPPLHPSDTPDLTRAEAFFRSLSAPTRLVLLSSAAAIDPSHHNTGYLTEEHRAPGRNPIARAWLDLEALAASLLPDVEQIVLRPVPVIASDGNGFFARLLRRRAAIVPAGYDPPLQLLSADDLAGAVLAALERGAGRPGLYHVAPAGAVPLRAALRLAGVRRVAVPRWSAKLDYLRHNWTVSSHKIAGELGFMPARTSAEALTGAPGPGFDPYGLDIGYIAAYARTLFRFLHDVYWRIEHEGLENVPRQGAAVLTGVHRGFMPWDGVMALYLLRRETGRIPRFLIHPCLIKFPFLANYMTKLGGLIACQENAGWVLGQGEILGMFPEGIHGAFTMYRDAYRLGRFGRDEYVKMALRNRAPIVPFVTVGSAEIYPILARIDSRLVRRVAEWPFLPITPTFPLPGLPLPSKWHTRFLEPIPVQEMYPPEAADDPETVRAISAEVRTRMEKAIEDMLARRKSIFWGSIFHAVLAVFVAVILLGAAPAERSEPWFEDVTAQAGVAQKHSNRVFHNPYAEIMAGYTALGAAAAVADYDGDGYEDLFVTDSAENGRNHLYHNDFGKTGKLTFTDVAVQAGLADGNDAENASADALWLDYDNDGRPDLLLVRFGHNKLYHNLGNGNFRDVTREAGLDRYLNAITAIAFDYDRDGYVDIFVGSYFQPVNIFHPGTPRFFPESFETANNGGGVTVFHNNRNGTFTDVTAKVGIHVSGWTLDLGHGDADNDGDDDLYVACDFGTDRFFINNGDGTFTDRTKESIGIDTKKGMNAEWGDYDNDGWLDVFVTNITDDYMREGNFLWHNNGNGKFSDVAAETGVRDTGWGWAGKFFDYDNDGWLDLYVVNGWVSAGPQSYVPDIFEMIVRPGVDFTDARSWPPMGGKSLSGYEKKKLFHNLGGLFKNEAARHGLDSTRDGRGIAVADFDNDGRLDLFVTNANAEPFLYHNIAPRAHWAGFVLEGRASNRDAIGAQLRLTAGGRTLLRFVDGGNGFASQSTRRVYFGLGTADHADRLEIRWPSGRRQVIEKPPIDRLTKIVEGQ